MEKINLCSFFTLLVFLPLSLHLFHTVHYYFWKNLLPCYLYHTVRLCIWYTKVFIGKILVFLLDAFSLINPFNKYCVPFHLSLWIFRQNDFTQITRTSWIPTLSILKMLIQNIILCMIFTFKPNNYPLYFYLVASPVSYFS